MAEDWRELVLAIQSVGYSACGVEFGGCKGIIHVDAEWAKHLVVGTTLSIRNYQMQWYEGEIHFNATERRMHSSFCMHQKSVGWCTPLRPLLELVVGRRCCRTSMTSQF
jgi:hypothetical protein